MRKVYKKATFPFLAGYFLTILCYQPANAQQYIIANKDNTRPETTQVFDSPALIRDLRSLPYNGYNDISWTAGAEQATRKFIVEYSVDGINYISAGTVMSTNGRYNLKHYTSDTRALIYRVKMEDLNGKSYYSVPILSDGIEISPVKVYPTIVRGNTINANAGLPVERLVITSADGQQKFAKELNGVSDFIPIVIPDLSKGLYFITFYGRDWKSTSRFLVS